MRRVHWTPDLIEAHIVANLLREHGVSAWAFDTEFVRQDWFKVLAFGGYRVMVSNADTDAALHVVGAYRNGELALPDEDVERPRCPACNMDNGYEDARPRRVVFMILIASAPLMWITLSLLRAPAELSWFAASYLIFQLALIWPGLAAYAITWRYRCAGCGRSWHAPPQRAFSDMTRVVEAESSVARGSTISLAP